MAAVASRFVATSKAPSLSSFPSLTATPPPSCGVVVHHIIRESQTEICSVLTRKVEVSISL